LKQTLKASLGATKPEGVEDAKILFYSILNKNGILAPLIHSDILALKLALRSCLGVRVMDGGD
jgi:hypothetical protein